VDLTHHLKETTLVLATDKPDVTIHTPVFTPAVLDDPIRSTIVITPASKKDGVIVLSLTRRIKDTTAVVEPLISVSTDRDWTVVIKVLTKIIFVINSDINPISPALDGSARIELAVTDGGGIRILFIGVDTVVLDDILEHIGLHTTIATIIAKLVAREQLTFTVTIDDVLLAKINKLALFKEKLTLHGSASTESEARTAITLILNGSNSTLVKPVERVRKIVTSMRSMDTTEVNLAHGSIEALGNTSSDELLMSTISKSIKTKSSTRRSTVHGVDSLLVLSVNTHTIGTLSSSRIGLVILVSPSLKFSSIFGVK